MFSLLLPLIYLAFISLGLPDSLLGSAWPVMYKEFSLPLSAAGVVTFLISTGTIVSSLLSNKLTKKFGAGVVTAVSVLMTAGALFGFLIAKSLIALCLWAVPYGLGAGAVDAALNNYVALHYASRHMSWLHCFWGVGAAISPSIMSMCLTSRLGWRSGYLIVAGIQAVLSVVLFASLPLWKKKKGTEDTVVHTGSPSFFQTIRIKGVKYVLITFFGYCALESTVGLWAASYLVSTRGLTTEVAARMVSMFFLGITGGRFLTGFIADKWGDKRLVRVGIFTVLSGIILIVLPINIDTIALFIIGLGCAPIYPSIIHATPFSFGRENSQAVIGIQMASAYLGSTLMPPLFGLVAEHVALSIFPIYLCLLAVLMLAMSEIQNRLLKRP